MSCEAEPPIPTPMEEEKVRIYVGGVGEGVREEELRRVFELAGGTVEAVDLIRTKGRSLAYVDFLPASHNSLSNLFAKYNGCVWKGAKLRLEKAKHHYLLRLTREWSEVEEVEANANANANSHSHSSSDNNSNNNYNNNIRIFFPRLRKVKSLPFSGTGKHKYSFQRPDLPSPLLPNYFCDCEQHSGPSSSSSSSSSSSTRKEKQVCHVQVEMESQGEGGGGGGDGINQEELNIMNKVMNTLFQNQTDALQFDDNANEQDEDEDNLIINVVTKENTHTHNTASLRRHQLSKHQDVSKLKRGNDNQPPPPPNKKKKSSLRGGNDFETAISENEGILRTNSDKSVEVESWEPKSGKHKASDRSVSWSQKSSWKKLVGDKGIHSFSIAGNNASSEEGEGHPISETCNVPDPDEENENLERDDELEDTWCKRKTEEGLVEEAQPADQNVVSTQTGRGAYWRHKSSWTQLISEKCSFSISQNFTGITSKSSNQQLPTKPKDAGVVSSAAKEGGPSVSEVRKEAMLEEKCGVAAKQTSPVKVEISDTCTFMRSATSLKEWAKTKAALSGSLKRKGTPK